MESLSRRDAMKVPGAATLHTGDGPPAIEAKARLGELVSP